MQYGTCHVRIGGDLNNEVVKAGVTPAEILLLRKIHGDTAVLAVAAGGNDKRPHKEEIDRLVTIYGKKMIEAAFPGLSPRLPVAFKDIGIDATAVIAAEAKGALRKPRVAKGTKIDDSDQGTGDLASLIGAGASTDQE